MYHVIKYVVNNIMQRKVRSFLTSLSILVGIMAIFALVSFGIGVSDYLDEVFEDLGTNRIMIQQRTFGPPGSGDGSFTDDDVDFVDIYTGIDVATGAIWNFGTIVQSPFEDTRAVAMVMGAATDGPGAESIRNFLTVDVEEGRYLRNDEREAAVLGNNYLREDRIFERPLSVGDRIILEGEEIRVVGFLESIGNPEDDSMIILDDDYYIDLFGTDGTYDVIIAEVDPTQDTSDIADRLEDDFRRHLGEEEGEETFSILVFEDILEIASTILDLIINLVVMIALISVVVAAINITNSLYISIMERTKEIGVMKAIGARNSVIRNIFLMEAGLLGFMGGVIGVALGYAIAYTGGVIADELGYGSLQPAFPIWLFVACISFATLVGAMAGYLPAWQASKQEAATSLRDE